MKKILALAAVAALTAGVSAYAANPFSDVTADDSAEDICEKLVIILSPLSFSLTFSFFLPLGCPNFTPRSTAFFKPSFVRCLKRSRSISAASPITVTSTLL